MNRKQLVGPEQLRGFLTGTREVEFQAWGEGDERYSHIEGVMKEFRYAVLGRVGKGVVQRYMERKTVYSRQQLTRLAARCLRVGKLAKAYHTEGGIRASLHRGRRRAVGRQSLLSMGSGLLPVA